jgi:hypothetical protein
MDLVTIKKLDVNVDSFSGSVLFCTAVNIHFNFQFEKVSLMFLTLASRDVMWNHLTGSIPSTLGQLTNLYLL